MWSGPESGMWLPRLRLVVRCDACGDDVVGYSCNVWELFYVKKFTVSDFTCGSLFAFQLLIEVCLARVKLYLNFICCSNNIFLFFSFFSGNKLVIDGNKFVTIVDKIVLGFSIA